MAYPEADDDDNFLHRQTYGYVITNTAFKTTREFVKDCWEA